MSDKQKIGILIGAVTFLAVLVIGVVLMAAAGIREKKTPKEPVAEAEEVVFVPEESTETTESTDASMTSRATRFIEDKESLGYNVVYDGEKAQQMLDELEVLYGQMPDVEKIMK